MPIGYREQTQLNCPACGAAFEAPVWLILDAQENPQEVEALHRNELNTIVCPDCGHRGAAGAPLLFHDGVRRQVIFAPAPGSAEHGWREQARALHALLVGSIDAELRRPYLSDVTIAQDLAGVARLIRRAEHRPVAPAPPAPPAGSATPDDKPPLLKAIEALLTANAPEEAEAVLAAHPVLRSPSADTAFAQLIEVALEQREFGIADALRNARALVARLVAATRPVADSPSPSASPAMPPEEVIQALLRTHTEAELETLVEAHPILLHPDTDRSLAQQVDAALDEGNDRLAYALEERREALAQMRSRKTQTAPADPLAATLDEAIEALLVAESQEALSEALDRYPMLLEDAAIEALWQFAAEARASGDEDLARYAIECREMLRRIRAALDERPPS